MGSMLLANAGLPTLFVIWPASWVLFFPVVLIEWLVARRLWRLPSGPALSAVALGNLASTLIAIPFVWFLMLPIAISAPTAHPDGFAGVMNNVVLHSAWLVPWSKEVNWMVPAAVLTLCIPFFFASVGMEYLIAKWMLQSRYPDARVSLWAWRANGLTYGIIALLLSAEIVRQATT